MNFCGYTWKQILVRARILYVNCELPKYSFGHALPCLPVEFMQCSLWKGGSKEFCCGFLLIVESSLTFEKNTVSSHQSCHLAIWRGVPCFLVSPSSLPTACGRAESLDCHFREVLDLFLKWKGLWTLGFYRTHLKTYSGITLVNYKFYLIFLILVLQY